MNARLQKLISDIREAFWVLPAGIILAGILAAMLLVAADRSGLAPDFLIESNWLYNGGVTGARTLLGAVASSMIGVAGTVFSITIAALSLAAGQMGPRLLRNFVHDRGNQTTLGAFLATYCYALVVLRSVRTQDEGAFIPHLALGGAMLLAFACVATLVYFVGHMAGRINVDTVVELVSEDMRASIARNTTREVSQAQPAAAFWKDATLIRDARRGYLQHLHTEGLASWAAEHGTAIRLLVRPGSYIFPGAPIAEMQPAVPGCEAAIQDATALGTERRSRDDLEHAVRQLVEVAVRALSPGINDPHTAIGVLDRLGAALCDVSPVHLGNGVITEGDRVVLVVPVIDYDGLTDAMFHMIRQNAAGSPAVLIRMLDVLVAVASCERAPARVQTLRRHAELVREVGGRTIGSPGDLRDLERRHRMFETACSAHEALI